MAAGAASRGKRGRDDDESAIAGFLASSFERVEVREVQDDLQMVIGELSKPENEKLLGALANLMRIGKSLQTAIEMFMRAPNPIYKNLGKEFAVGTCKWKFLEESPTLDEVWTSHVHGCGMGQRFLQSSEPGAARRLCLERVRRLRDAYRLRRLAVRERPH